MGCQVICQERRGGESCRRSYESAKMGYRLTKADSSTQQLCSTRSHSRMTRLGAGWTRHATPFYRSSNGEDSPALLALRRRRRRQPRTAGLEKVKANQARELPPPTVGVRPRSAADRIVDTRNVWIVAPYHFAPSQGSSSDVEALDLSSHAESSDACH